MKNIKSNAGITGIDIAVSLGIISVTIMILSALYFSTYISNVEIERRTQAINYASQIFEKVSEYYYSDVTPEKFAVTTNSNGKNEVAGIEIPKAYTVSINIENYKSEAANDVVKNIQVSITYNVGNKPTTLTLNRYKTKETLIIPNSPELRENMIAIKVQKSGSSSNYKTTTVSDIEWYNYTKKKWALAKIQDNNNTVTLSDLYVWIPRYAYYIDDDNNINIEFLYSNKNQKVNKYGNLENISFEYIVDTKFSGENARGYWIKISELETDEVANILNNSKYGNLIY